jgi:hypothetical protein
MDRLTETPELLRARLAAQAEVATTRDALLRAVLALPNFRNFRIRGNRRVKPTAVTSP